MSTSTRRRSTHSAAAKDASSEPETKRPKKTTTSKSKTTSRGKAKKETAKSTPPSNSDAPWFTAFTKDDEQYTEYMKNEWCFERRGDEAMFEKISLEGAQAGLSWLTILRKREAYRKAFHHFDIDKVAKMTDKDVQKILDTPKSTPSTDVVVKHRGKIEAVIHNAKCIQEMRKEAKGQKLKYGHGVLDDFLWSFIDNKPIVNNAWDGKNLNDSPSTSPESTAMSKALRDKGFKFVGPTTCYSMMQAYGMVIDHPPGSAEYEAAMERLKKRPDGYQVRGKKNK